MLSSAPPLYETKSLSLTLGTLCAGLPFDRQWMVVQESTGKFVTQRQVPNLCKVCRRMKHMYL
jgi:uncharacterized protein YcbX